MTTKEKLFCREYLKDFNAGKAYLRAGYDCDINSARASACRLLKRSDIDTCIRKLVKKKTDKLDISAEQIIAKYWQIANAEMTDYVSWPDGSIELHQDPKGGDFTTGPLIKVYSSDEVDPLPIQEIGYSAKEGFKIKLADKKAALDSLARILGFFDDKMKLDVTEKITFVNDLDE